MLHSLGKVSGIGSRERFGSARLGLDSRIRRKGHIVTRVTERVSPETFSERMNLQFIPFASILGFGVVLCFRGTIGESVILIGFLRISIWTNLLFISIM
jgi:hypothetical protein